MLLRCTRRVKPTTTPIVNYVFFICLSSQTLPDLERALSRVHAMGSLARKLEHPDGKAILYEMKKYGVRTIKAFLAVLNGMFCVLYDLLASILRYLSISV